MSGWSLLFEGYEPAEEGLRETLCALGNGYLVSRAAAPDAVADGAHYPGTYLAGLYNRLTTEVAGRAVENEDLVNIPNWLPLMVRIDDGEWLGPGRAEVSDYHQELDIRQGVLTRRLALHDPAGHILRWSERRIVSMADQHLAALAVSVTAENFDGRITLRSGLDGSVVNGGVARYRKLASRHLETLQTERIGHGVVFLRSRTRQSRREIALAARTSLHQEGGAPAEPSETITLADIIAEEWTVPVTTGQSVMIQKVAAVHNSADRGISEAGMAAVERATNAPDFDVLLAAHRLAWAHLWAQCDIDIETDVPQTATTLRLHIFHLLQTVSRHSEDLDIGVPPRGWHGEAYRGHIMWDELFIFPFLNLRIPLLTRALLRYRYRRLPSAERAARREGVDGAMFPWQSGSDGREESQRIHLNPLSGNWIADNSHRQRHINAAIAYNVWHYYQVTEDRAFLHDFGAELLVRTGRLWASLARYNPEMDRYEIKGVMGPDEFHTAYPDADPSAEGGIDNNAYTNVMASWSLARTLDVVDLLPKSLRQRLCETLGVKSDDLDLWDEISCRLRVPFHDEGIISQFDGYGDLEEFDWEGYRKRYGDIQRLDRILESENDTPNRYKASKQADVLMLFYLFSAEELGIIFDRLGYPFGRDTIPRNIEYYMQRTSHGSTLSWLVHAWVLARSDRRAAWELFRRALNSDVADIQGGTTPEGIHLGAMAGTIDVVQRCFTGIDTRANVLHFDPVLPEGLDRLRTTVRYRQQVLDVTVDHERLTISSRSSTAFPITVAYRGHVRDVTPGDSYTFRLICPEDRCDDSDGRRTPSTSGCPAS